MPVSCTISYLPSYDQKATDFLFYLIALAITELPYAVAAVYLGESFLEGNATVFILSGAAVILLGFFLLRIFKKVSRR